MLRVLNYHNVIFQKRVEFLNLISTFFEKTNDILITSFNQYQFIEFYYSNKLFQLYYLKTKPEEDNTFNVYKLVIFETQYNSLENKLEKTKEIEINKINHSALGNIFFCELEKSNGGMKNFDNIHQFKFILDRYFIELDRKTNS